MVKKPPRKYVLEVTGLGKSYRRRQGFWGKSRPFQALQEVSFKLERGEILAVVGESGCGKSTLAKILMGMIEADQGAIISEARRQQNGTARAKRQAQRYIQMVFQDPYSSLNPRRTIGESLIEPLQNFAILPPAQFGAEVARLLTLVGLPPEAADKYPHAFSGGQRQRICIARALAARPEVLICDEAVSALDVSVKAQIVSLLLDIRRQSELSLLFISHDMGIVEYIADRVLVMQSGRLVEIGPADQIFGAPKTDYTRQLIAAVPALIALDPPELG